ncbi:MAG: hypothetical protein KAS16_08920 [Thermoplasmata archaeon]|nr:hypothetical protein [Thermoplasmata archaeon]
MSTPMIIAHRGASKLAPENTIRSFHKALEYGATYIELDIRITNDDVPVIFHDQKVNRMTNGSGFLSQMNLASLKELQVKKTEKIPTLEEVLEEFEGKCVLVLDIKVRNAVLPAYKLVKKHGWLKDVIFTSKEGITIMKLKEKDGARLGFSNQDKKVDTLHVASALNVEFILPEFRLINSKLLDEAREKKIKVMVWTVDCPFKMKKLAKLGVDGIITNRPGKLVEVLGR